MCGGVRRSVSLAVVALSAGVVGAREGDVQTRVVQLEQVLTASDGAPGDQLGQSVAIDGDRAVTGAPRDRIGNNSTQGSAYVFVRGGTTWSQETKLTAFDGQAEDKFGNSVAISGDTLVVGAATAAVGPDLSRGAAYVFTRSGSVWSLQSKLLASDGAALHRFGTSVAIDGDTVVVGAPGPNLNQGAAYVFVRSAGQWSQQAKLLASDGASQHQLGFAVGVSGDVAAIGAIGADQSRGAVYTFRRTGPAWTEEQKVVSADRQAGDRLGFSVALDQDTLAAGAIDDSTGTTQRHGSAYVFVRQGPAWGQQQKLTAGDAAAFDGLGGSIALRDDALVVGVQPEAAPQPRFSAYVFERSVGVWTQQQKLTSGSGASDGFGRSVALAASRVLVGAPFLTAGAAYVYGGSTPNTAPSIAAAGPQEREQGAAPAPSVVATVSDAEDPAGSLAVTGVAPAGISLSGLSNSDGTITAILGAECTAPVGAAPVALTVTDSGGLTASDTLLVHVVANTVPPTITCGPDIAAIAAPGQCTATVGYPLPAAADDCPGSTVSCAPPPGSVFPAGATAVTCTAFDAAGNTATCPFTVTVTPNLTIAPEGQAFPGTGGSGQVAVSAAGGCAWTAVSNEAWITITSGPGGNGAGTVAYTVAAQTAPTPRAGTMAIAGRTFTVTQDGVVPALADLEVAFGGPGNAANVGSPHVYTVTVTNHGPAPAAGVQVANPFNARAQYVSAAPSQGTVANVSGELRWQVGDLPSGGSAVLTVAGVAGTPGLVLGSARVTSTVPDPEPGNDAAETVWIFIRRPPTDLAITSLVASPSRAVVGRPLTYTIGIANYGPTRAKQIVLRTLMLPAGEPLPGVTFVSASSARGAAFAFDSYGALRYDLGGLEAGEADTLTVVVVPTVSGTPRDLWPLLNVAHLTTAPYLEPDAPPGSDPDADLSNNDALASTIVLPATGADLEITRVSASASPVVVGADVSYLIEAVNHGPDTALDVRLLFDLRAPVPALPRVRSGAPSQGSCSLRGARSLRCTLGAIPPSGAISLVVSVYSGLKADRGPYDLVGAANIFVAAAPTHDPDPDRSNNSAEARVLVTPPSGYNLAVTSFSATPTIVPAGSPVTYTMEVVNWGPESADEVHLQTLVTHADPRAPTYVDRGDLTFVSATVSQGTCSYQLGSGLSCALEGLAAGGRATLTVTAVPVVDGDFTNYGIARNVSPTVPDLDLDRSDNVRSVTTHSLAPLGVDLAITRFEAVPDPFEARRLIYRVDVKNRGPVATFGFPIVIRLPAEPQAVRSIISEGPVAQVHGGIVETFTGRLLPGDTTTLMVAVTFEPWTTDLVSHAAVSCGYVETNPADNTATAVTPRAARRR